MNPDCSEFRASGLQVSRHGSEVAISASTPNLSGFGRHTNQTQAA